MTTKTDEQERAEFERWHLLRYMFEAVWHPDGGVYLGHAQGRWEAYQAGRAAPQSQDREDAERWREFIKGHAVECHGTRPNGSKWSYFLGYRLDKLEGWKERFTEAIDAARAAARGQ